MENSRVNISNSLISTNIGGGASGGIYCRFSRLFPVNTSILGNLGDDMDCASSDCFIGARSLCNPCSPLVRDNCSVCNGNYLLLVTK